MYVCMYVCIYIYVCMYVCIYMYLSLYMGYITNALLQFSGDGGSPCSTVAQWLSGSGSLSKCPPVLVTSNRYDLSLCIYRIIHTYIYIYIYIYNCKYNYTIYNYTIYIIILYI